MRGTFLLRHRRRRAVRSHGARVRADAARTTALSRSRQRPAASSSSSGRSPRRRPENMVHQTMKSRINSATSASSKSSHMRRAYRCAAGAGRGAGSRPWPARLRRAADPGAGTAAAAQHAGARRPTGGAARRVAARPARAGCPRPGANCPVGTPTACATPGRRCNAVARLSPSSRAKRRLAAAVLRTRAHAAGRRRCRTSLADAATAPLPRAAAGRRAPRASSPATSSRKSTPAAARAARCACRCIRRPPT